MHTRCPGCQAVFRIVQSELDAAGGKVRCGQCRHVFDARAALQRELPLAPQAGPEPVLDRHVQLRFPEHGPEYGGAPSPVPHGSGRSPERHSIKGVLISEIEGEVGDARPGRWVPWHISAWGGANLLLVALLAAQLLFIQRDAFAQDPTLRPVLVRMCDVVGCTLPSRQAVDRIELLRRQVYAHPNVDGALLIDLTFVNNARFPQPFPTLTVTMGDLQGEPLVRRHFEPREYEPRLSREARMAPGSPVNVVLEVHDPGVDARTFDLDLY